MKRLIFLDIDGVLVHIGVCEKVERETGEKPPWSQEFMGRGFLGFPDADCMERLNDLVLSSGADVVLSSTWRRCYSLDLVSAFLRKCGARFDLHDATDVTKSIRRGPEIQRYLDGHECDAFVVLDDSVSDIVDVPGLSDHVVHVRDGWIMDGLQDHHVKKAKEILK